MNRIIIYRHALFACLVFISSICLASSNPLIRWEYKTVKVELDYHQTYMHVGSYKSHGYSTLDIQKLDTKLNEMANEGWKLVSLTGMAPYHGGVTRSILATFKRIKRLDPA